MGFGIKLEVWGEYALFTRPEMKVERVSYDVITPSAARGIIEAIYWKRAIKWVIDKIHVCNKIQFTNIRRNEVSIKIAKSNAKALMDGTKTNDYINTNEQRQQRASLVLKDVRYVIEAHFELTDKAGGDDTVEKHYNIALRRMRQGQCYHTPCFGCREFPAKFRLVEDDSIKTHYSGEQDLGFMLYDMNFSDSDNIHPIFFRAKMADGVIDLKNIAKVG
ncbi:type I-C CRISPR-associated protein Cas5c [Ruminiclostridium cellulolyticum]|uniref:pre-crRNA processing endonuclease n=1 Tax=Ruminiclostridium cellulolyticum (strain ATCC 35319 / DSM 5812 / JCM 6584 / H10) TaxID=394503 RepID=B8I205_RUMCH|nr:type I-C CRISPR-associated protein Cas5c [Ruminiclostridium cellulolyticum]ACL75831.1 CRISPR-associated protein Cas5 family [Ruminiclostridium cellulolyticum H10]